METLGLLIFADKVFSTGTGPEIIPENEIDKRTIGDGKPRGNHSETDRGIYKACKRLGGGYTYSLRQHRLSLGFYCFFMNSSSLLRASSRTSICGRNTPLKWPVP